MVCCFLTGRGNQIVANDALEKKLVTPLLPPIHPLSMKADDSEGLVVVFSPFPWQHEK